MLAKVRWALRLRGARGGELELLRAELSEKNEACSHLAMLCKMGFDKFTLTTIAVLYAARERT